MGKAFTAQAAQGVECCGMVLARLQCAHHEQPRAIERPAWTHAGDLARGRGGKGGVNALVDHMDFGRIGAVKISTMSRRVCTDGDNSIRRVDKTGHGRAEKEHVAACVVLGIAFGDQIVHCKYGGAGHVW